MLRDEAISAQSANVDIISGATLTSKAFIQSLRGALKTGIVESMRETRILMGMPITVDVGSASEAALIDEVFAYFECIDRRFSTYRADSEIAAINRGDVPVSDYSREMRDVLALAEQTKNETNGFFDIRKPDGSLDPSGIVKGWAIRNAADIVRRAGVRDFFIEAGGDIQSSGKNAVGNATGVSVSATRSRPTRSSRSSTRADAASPPLAPMYADSTSTIPMAPTARSRTSSA